MLKRAISVILQLLLFLFLFLAGSFMPVFGLLPRWQVSAGVTRVFMLDGLVLMAVAFVIILAIEAARKRLRVSGALTTLAFFLALALGLAMKIGFISL